MTISFKVKLEKYVMVSVTILCVILSFTIITTSTLSDAVASLHYIKNNIILRCLLDSATHGIIGVISMLLTCLYSKLLRSAKTNIAQWVTDIVISVLYACFIDVDHFIAAGSLDLKAATTLIRRPPFHCTTLMVIPSLMLLSVSYIMNQQCIGRIACVSIIATISHHLRDAQRRGLWLWPFGSTQTLTFGWHTLSQLLSPILVGPLYAACSARKEIILEKELII